MYPLTTYCQSQDQRKNCVFERRERNPNDISRRRRHTEGRKEKNWFPYSAARRGLADRSAANPEYQPEGPAVVQGAGEKEDRPE
ncbi:hypothetical protein CEXT_699051 [Caerostris extrusa]|uniref:Uncharacterized protein n=1 Tax=Caerostris extrusa TaxID=172846 RepID=A0AAV4VVZ6_CAEEX|nr:hypothetical protein CEXT_699051 [Caerostris extrusa]